MCKEAQLTIRISSNIVSFPAQAKERAAQAATSDAGAKSTKNNDAAALIRWENAAAARNSIVGPEHASKLAALLRTQVASNPASALQAHGNISAQSLSALLS